MELDLNISNPSLIPHLEQYFGVWAVEPSRFRGMIETVSKMDMAAHVEQKKAIVEPCAEIIESGIDVTLNEAGGYFMARDVAIIPLSGTLTKHGSSLATGGSMILARRRIANALRDSSVRSIVMRIDSPGGTVHGTNDLAEDIAKANTEKPVIAYIEDLGASAAYWISSQAGTILSNASAYIGSIGVFAVVHDMSAMADELGIKVHVIKTGEFKGAGAPGSKITDAQLQEWQRQINSVYDLFVGSIAQGRRMDRDQVLELSDGRVWIASDAKGHGLIDDIASLAEAIEFARQQPTNRLFRAEKERTMKAQSWNESLKAVLEGRPNEANDEHRDLAIETVKAVREHDAPSQQKALDEAKKSAGATLAEDERKKLAQETSKAERERAVEILESCGKVGLSGQQAAEFVRSGEPTDKVMRKIIDKSAESTQKPLHAQNTTEIGTTETDDEKEAVNKAYSEAVDQLAGTKQ